jgi:hypothetical protein
MSDEAEEWLPRERVVARREMLGSSGRVYRIVEFEKAAAEVRPSEGEIVRATRLELEDGTPLVIVEGRLTNRLTEVTLTELD